MFPPSTALTTADLHDSEWVPSERLTQAHQRVIDVQNLTNKAKVVLSILLVQVGTGLTNAYLGSSLSIFLTLQVPVLIVSLAIIRYTLVGERQSAHLSITRILALGLAALAVAVVAQRFQLFEVALTAVAPFLPLDSATVARLLKSAQAPTEYLLAIYFFVIAAIIVAALAAVANRQVVISAIPETKFTESDITAIKEGIRVQLLRLIEASEFIDADHQPIQTQVEEADSFTPRFLQPTLEKLVANLGAQELLVLKGEPGSGKSLALRQVALRLLDNISANSKLPIYLNLREWIPPSHGPAQEIEQSFFQWVQTACTTQTTFYLGRFFTLDKFNQLYSHGRFTFLFDSFDEIPAVVDQHHESELVKEISGAIAAFIKASGGCSAVIASRNYKAPILGGLPHSIYLVRQFDDHAVREYVTRFCRWPTQLLDCIYLERRDLFVVSRNPFSLALLVHFYNAHSATPPISEYELYDAFFTDKLIRAATGSADAEEVVERAVDIAENMATTIHVQSPPVSSLEPSTLLDDGSAITALLRARIIADVNGRHRFIHRRFLEFFVVRRLLAGTSDRPTLAAGYLDANRDILSLYGGICTEEDARALAAEAVNYVSEGLREYQENGSYEEYEKLLIALRFLRDTFRVRMLPLSRFRTTLHNAVVQLWNTNDLMKQKHSVEHLCFLPTPVAISILTYSLQTNSGWLKRAALSEARYITGLQPWLGMQLAKYAISLSDTEHYHLRTFLRETRSMEGSQAADKALIETNSLTRVAFYVVLLLGLYFSPVVTLSLAMLALMLFVFFRSLSPSNEAVFRDIGASGFNCGLTGFVANLAPWAIFWTFVGMLFVPQRWNLLTWSELIFLIATFSCSIGLLLSSKLAGRRVSLWQQGLSWDDLNLIQRFDLGQMVQWGSRMWIPAALLVGSVAAFFFDAYDSFSSWWHSVIVGVFLGAAIWLFGSAARSLLRLYLDARTIKNLRAAFTPSRSSLATDLAQLRTDFFRFRYLRWVSSRPTREISELLSPFDDWPNAQRPQYRSHNLNNLLAILEETWRGLDRR